ncbi:Por secretion system C-terminal sorting domain-containing protein [Saccharicrinis carchari]|uniref:Por secretion system C-terminal sorting domain-containing protein n=1 Tax=Saccharicrinis carchari TaxID=1168039 RepID=A0A521EJC1_SACCC|nr:cellulase family glycosylhydrolase [Saccharicrinis carchari]SMO84013.1 Por secretion system C-terminal sorting domain-containing protein [Saccharicrinis carchari]
MYRILLLLALMSLFNGIKAVNVNGYLKAEGTQIVNNDGNFIIRGLGPGGWMLQEGYMFGTANMAGTQHQIRAMLEDLTDKATTDLFYEQWLANFFKLEDVQLVAHWGFNSIRVPLHYNLFTPPVEDEPVQGQITWLSKGFEMLDGLLSWCEANDLYLILDLHAAPGGQGKNADISDYDPSKPSLWESELNKQKMVALWGKLAQRYHNKTHIGGYDLLNETNWDLDNTGNDSGCTCNENAPLLALYQDVIDEIRLYDSNHIIFIEGNCWANNFNGLHSLADYDNNIAFSFHKYWNYNSQTEIQGILDLRHHLNIPLYLGETGENSNTWLTDMVKLCENLNIGWSTWAYKQMDIDDPFTMVSDKWQAIVDYTNGGAKPDKATAAAAMAEMTTNLLIENCVYNEDVVYAITQLPYGAASKPFKEHNIPGIIFCTDYDIGLLNDAWNDKGYQNLHGSTGIYTAPNQGYAYRNDGVDIEACLDFTSNGYNIGWTENGEWLKYTLNNITEGYYDITFRVASPQKGQLNLLIGSKAISPSQHIEVPNTNGYQAWSDVKYSNVFIGKNEKEIKLYIIQGGFNLNYIHFDLVTPTALPKEMSASGLQIKQVSSTNHLSVSINSSFNNKYHINQIQLFDMHGRIVESKPDFLFSGSSSISFNKADEKGIYILQLYADKNKITQKLIQR